MFLLLGLLRQIIRKGALTVIGPDGRSSFVGHGAPSVTIRIVDPSVIPRLVFNPDLALGEAYMDGALTVENGDIYDFLDLCFVNLGWSSGHGLRRVRATLKRLVRRIAQHNPIPVARANVAHHYDLSDTLYDLFLDADRQYSCAYFASADETLERAQEQKKRHLAAKLLLQPGQRILDIGSGWGGLGLYLTQTADVDVTGLTLSTEQNAYAQRRSHDMGVADNVRFLLKDYRQEHGRYDRIVSVGMFEHVGVGHYPEYFEKIRDLLDEDGIALIHTIGRADGPGAANGWINKYIFPGGYVPALSEILPAIERAGLYVTDIEVLRLHYAETLKAWRQRFNMNRQRVAEVYDERFCRMWEFYLAGCEAAFRHGGLLNFQIQLSKRIDAVPLTRDYIVDWEHSRSVEVAATGFPNQRYLERSGGHVK
ncbi:cyclopropane-fatty-acyl-phospholipid synthase [Roseiarcaceae bacterium H3SJ34-1]|uniref:class I SAM-dependent methyltransferase n=1 Tax=Terripilifer ovatus TaxID=3032367 RepID=UPI003AB9BBE3|nr:cyclopropane-fatty-acyl-phospholipid synthase [Roseiarcaceae bacterium H3SJ34-1]